MSKELEQLFEEYRALAARLADIESVKNTKGYIEDSKRFSDLSFLGEYAIRHKQVLSELEQAKIMAQTEPDTALRAMADDEIISLSRKLEECENEAWQLCQDRRGREGETGGSSEMILEIRAGTGGDEAALFASDLFEMYQRYCANRHWDMVLIHENRDELGGYKEIVVEIKGKGSYDAFQYERGVHRVQRIPVTEKSGRVHTSTATVAVLPVVKDLNIEVQDKDLEIEFIRSSGPGGQNVNKLSTAVRMKHIATGITVFCQSQRHQHQNREKALEILKSKLYQREFEERQKTATSERRAQVGSGDRSEKIRTYNFPQDRITDHRINQSWKNIGRILNGDLDIIWNALREGKII